MTSADPAPRRFLIATAVARYHRSPGYDRPELARARKQVIDLFTGQLGYDHVSDLGLNPDRNTLLDQLDQFANDEDRRPDDIVAVYLTGHGELIGATRRRHMFFTSDADVDRPQQALPTSQIASVLLDGSKLNRVLLLLDTCHSGQGGRDAVLASLDDLGRTGGPNSGIVVVAGSRPMQFAVAEAFPGLLTAAVETIAATVENTAPTLELGAIVRHMNANPERPAIQLIEWNAGRMAGQLPPFFANPRHRAEPRTVERAIRTASTWDSEDLRRNHELTTRMVPAAMASVNAEDEWWFAGRRRALADMREWLREPGARSPLLVVTASPGSGKTALLGLVAMLADPDRHEAVPVHSLGLSPSVIPDVGSVDVTIYAQALTNAEVMRGLAAAAQVRTADPDDFLDALSGRDRPFTALIDAVDEAETPDLLLSRLIVPLLEHNEGRLRLVLGTRPHLLRQLPGGERIDLDDQLYADREALRAYARRVLIESTPDSPYRNSSPSVTSDVASAVAEAATPSFLVARITALTLTTAGRVPQRRDREWRESLPRNAGTAMAHDLDRLGDNAGRARDLLRPLAYAEGQGLPWEDLWAPIASALAGRRYTDEDLRWLRNTAGGYLIENEDSEHGTVHKLYHAALAEHLRAGIDEQAVHAGYVDVLTRRIRRTPDGRRNWAGAHPYTLRHLTSHAAKAGRLDELLADTDYLVHAHPDALVRNLRQVTDAHSRRVADIYRTTADHRRFADPVARRQLLAVDAARHGDAELAGVLAQPFRWRPRWATGSQTGGALHATLSGHTNSINALTCTDLGGVPVAVTAGDDHTVRVWDLGRGLEMAALRGHDRAVQAVACSVVDGVPVAVSVGGDPVVRVWNLLTNQQQATLIGDVPAERIVVCTTVHGVPAALACCSDNTVRVWDLTTGAAMATLAGHTGPVKAITCDELDGVPVAITASDDRTVRIWNLATGTPHSVLIGHTGAVNTLHHTTLRGEPIAITGSDDRTVRIWDLTTGRERGRLVGHAGWVNAVACLEHEGRAMIVVASDNPVVQVWDPIGQTLLMSLEGHTDWVTAAACVTVDDVPLAVTASHDGTVRVWHLLTGQQTARFTGHTDWITALACVGLPGGPAVVSAGHDRTIRVWHLGAARDRATLVGHSGVVNTLASCVVAGVPVAASGSDDRTVRIWNLATGQEHGRLTGHTGWVNAVTCDVLDGMPVAITASDDRTVRVWNLSTGQEHGRLVGHTGWVKTVACHVVDGVPTAITGSDDRTVRRWDLRTGEELDRLTGHTDWVGAIACTDVNGTPVAVTGSHDGTVLLWDLRTPHVVRVLTGHSGPVNAVACVALQDQPAAVTVSNDHTVRVWDLAAGVAVGTLTGHEGWVNSVACGVWDGVPVAVTGGDDRTVRVWDLVGMRETDCWTLPYEVEAVAFGVNGDVVVGTGQEVVDLRPCSHPQ